MQSSTVENYLKALFVLQNEKGEAAVNEVSRHLNIKMPTVNSMMKKLHEKGLVEYESYKPLKLTEKGKLEAAMIIRKHRLTEMYLVEKMGFGWEQVHPIAEQLEHLNSPEFFKKMDELLGFPRFDPHGSPIPDARGNVEGLTHKALADCKPFARVSIAAVTDSSQEFLEFLNRHGLQLGSHLLVKQVEAFDGSVTVEHDNLLQTFSKLVAEKLLVSEEVT